jgi:hypothetical protein
MPASKAATGAAVKKTAPSVTRVEVAKAEKAVADWRLATRASVTAALAAGKALAEVRDSKAIGHGDVLAWYRELGIGERTAQRLMELHRLRHLIPAPDAPGVELHGWRETHDYIVLKAKGREGATVTRKPAKPVKAEPVKRPSEPKLSPQLRSQGQAQAEAWSVSLLELLSKVRPPEETAGDWDQITAMVHTLRSMVLLKP